MIRHMWIVVGLMLMALEASGQIVQSTPQVRYYDPGRTTANRTTYRYSGAAVPVRPPLYNYYYYAPKDYGYNLNQTIAPNPSAIAPLTLGPVQPYSDVEYSRLVLSTLGVGVVEPASARLEARTIVQEAPSNDTAPRYKKVQAHVLDILDRGTLLLETGEELKLRGLRIPSERNTNDTMRFYAREAARNLRARIANAPVYIVLEDPLRDTDGSLMGMVYLSDGTELNRLMLTQGFGEFEPRDFTEDRQITALAAAAAGARDSKVGIWSVDNY